MNFFFKRVHKSDFCNTPLQRGFLPGIAFQLFADVNRHPFVPVPATLSNAGASTDTDLLRIFLNHHLLSNDNSDHVVIRSPIIADRKRPFPIAMHSLHSTMCLRLGDMYSTGFYAWCTQTMRLVVRPSNPNSAPSEDVHMMEVEGCALANNVEIVEDEKCRDE